MEEKGRGWLPEPKKESHPPPHHPQKNCCRFREKEVSGRKGGREGTRDLKNDKSPTLRMISEENSLILFRGFTRRKKVGSRAQKTPLVSVFRAARYKPSHDEHLTRNSGECLL